MLDNALPKNVLLKDFFFLFFAQLNGFGQGHCAGLGLVVAGDFCMLSAASCRSKKIDAPCHRPFINFRNLIAREVVDEA